MDLLKDSVKKLYFRYLFPSMGSAVVASVYLMTDAVVIGKGIGDNALAALNMTTPIISFMLSIGILFGIGGSVLFSVHKGTGNDEKANKCFTTALIGVLTGAVIICLLCNIFDRQILALMGAKDELFDLAYDYVRFYYYFSIPSVLVNFCSAFVRSDKDPNRAMVAVTAGGIVNVVFDIVLVYPAQMGIAGAAIASVSGITVQLLVCLTHFLSKKNTIRISKPVNTLKNTFQIVKGGLSGFITELSNAIIIFVFNLQLLNYCSNAELAVYGVLANCAILFNALFVGVGQAVQPVSAFNFGAGQSDRIAKLRRYAYTTVLIMGVIFSLSGILFPEFVASCFIDLTDATRTVTTTAMPIYFIAFFVMGVNVLSTYYFQSLMKGGYSLAVSMLRNIFISSLLLITLPMLFGGFAIWFAIPITEIAVAVISVILLIKSNNKMKSKI